MKGLLSIKPEFVEGNNWGQKKIRIRKSIFTRTDVSSVVVYATKPFGKVVGEFEIGSIIRDRPSNIWNETKNYSGISQKFFNEYFEGRDVSLLSL